MEGVKSARRVFEFLEYCSEVQREVSVAEIAKHYGYPVSSVSTVMRTMAAMGYFTYDGRSRTYMPAARLLSLVRWVGTRLFRFEAAREVMQTLSDATGETILLAVQSGLKVHYVDVIAATRSVRLHVEAGSFRDMTATAVGRMLLSLQNDDEVQRYVRRVSSVQPSSIEKLDVAELLSELRKIREQGHATSIGGVVDHGGAIAVLLPESFGPTPVALGIGSVRSVLENNEQRFIDLLHETVALHSPNAKNS